VWVAENLDEAGAQAKWRHVLEERINKHDEAVFENLITTHPGAHLRCLARTNTLSIGDLKV